MAGRQTAIGKVLADINGKIERLAYAHAMVTSRSADDILAEMDKLQMARDLVGVHDTPRATNDAPKPRKARTKKQKPATEEK